MLCTGVLGFVATALYTAKLTVSNRMEKEKGNNINTDNSNHANAEDNDTSMAISNTVREDETIINVIDKMKEPLQAQTGEKDLSDENKEKINYLNN